MSIGTPPAQSGSSTNNMLSPNQDNKNSLDMLDTLTSPPALSAQASSPVGSSMIDLLDGFGASSSVPGMFH